MIPSGQFARIWINEKWHLVEHHPELEEYELWQHLKAAFGEEITQELQDGVEAVFDYQGERFLLSTQENYANILILIRRLKPLPEPNEWPPSAKDWLETGGTLKINDPALYSALLKRLSQHAEGNIVSLEQRIYYPAKSYLGLIHQKELGEHFDTIQEGLEQAKELHPIVLAFQGIEFSTEDLSKIEKGVPLLMCA